MGLFVVLPGLNRWLMRLWLPLVVLVSPALMSPAAVRSQVDDAPAEAQAGLLTIESDQQSANSSTGVITASGNVRLVHADRGLVATGRQAQYFSREQRIVLSGDVDVVQTDGHTLRADQVTVLLDEERTLATTSAGKQVISSWSLQDPGAAVTQ